MDFALGPKALAAGYRLAFYENVVSTSNEAFAWARLGDRGRLWVVARSQSGGHGRRGNPWQTLEGSLAASLLMLKSDLGSTAATLGFAAGIALADAIGAVAGRGDDPSDKSIRLKWPNDVLCGGAKVAGILLEAVSIPGGDCVVVGIGVNVREAPADLPYPTTSLAACGIETRAEILFAALAEAWTSEVAVWDAGRGFAAIRAAWLDRAAGVGAPISVRSGPGVVSGTFETIDEEGRLIIRSDDGRAHPISAGEVHYGASATAVA